MMPKILHVPCLPLDRSWTAVPEATIDWFHPNSATYRPEVVVRIAHSRDTVHLRWRVADRYVVARTTEVNGEVWKDSCVEWFVQPEADGGYFNLEINAAGTPLLSYVEDATLIRGIPRRRHLLPAADIAAIRIVPSLPRNVDAELPGSITWTLDVDVPLVVFANFLGRPLACSGSWRCNLYHCADDSSHPRWGAWSPIAESFHEPAHFGIWNFS